MKTLLQHKFTIAGVLAGAIAGYAWYHFVGCSGSCAITSSPVNSTLYGAFTGGLLFSTFKRNKEKHD